MSRMHFQSTRSKGRILALFIVTLLGGSPAWAQPFAVGETIPKKQPREGPVPLAPTTEYHPDRVYIHLLAIHGFTRQQLDAASINVPQILMGWIDDPAQSVLIRRQAIKALKLYPTDDTFAFIADRATAAPSGFLVLYLGSLSGFTDSNSVEISALLEPLLDNENVVVRHATVELAGRLKPSAVIESMLQARMAAETDPSLRRAILDQLLSR